MTNTSRMSLAIRPATILDKDWLFSQLKLFSQFNGTKLDLFGGSDEYKEALLKNIIDNHLLVICEKYFESGSLPVGLICGMFHPHHFNPNIKMLTEQFWWVQPEYRNTKAGLLLLEEYERVGYEMADWVTFSLLPHSPVSREFLEQRGYKLTEMAFLKEHIKGPFPEALDG